ncbi:hypothetical protein [Pseudoalteromonas umbrosa]|uniref:hypothetical protein n=1 Tax=Pseudoalteromonas umbrosa TaxID=3048489 RepID=UPI0024C28F99|nr:hypothetical protein [Pseudoalteromonas sp. B95]MDK1290158.1 hypothetical protein [Pseudoalteromonas sp. B95]
MYTRTHHDTLESTTYYTLMRQLGVSHVTLSNGLGAYHIDETAVQQIIDAIGTQLGHKPYQVALGGHTLQSFDDLLTIARAAANAT